LSQEDLEYQDALRKVKKSMSTGGDFSTKGEVRWRYNSAEMPTGLAMWDDEELLGDEDYVK